MWNAFHSAVRLCHSLRQPGYHGQKFRIHPSWKVTNSSCVCGAILRKLVCPWMWCASILLLFDSSHSHQKGYTLCQVPSSYPFLSISVELFPSKNVGCETSTTILAVAWSLLLPMPTPPLLHHQSALFHPPGCIIVRSLCFSQNFLAHGLFLINTTCTFKTSMMNGQIISVFQFLASLSFFPASSSCAFNA